MAISVSRLGWLVLGVAVFAGCERVGAERAALFEQGRELVTVGKSAKAQVVLQQYLRDAPAAEHTSRAAFFIAKTLLGQGELVAARAKFSETLTRYPQTLEAHKSRYQPALIDLLVGDMPAAQRGFAKLVDDANDSQLPKAAALQRSLGTAAAAFPKRFTKGER